MNSPAIPSTDLYTINCYCLSCHGKIKCLILWIINDSLTISSTHLYTDDCCFLSIHKINCSHLIHGLKYYWLLLSIMSRKNKLLDSLNKFMNYWLLIGSIINKLFNVFKMDCSSEYNTHIWSKLGLFRKKIGFDDSFDVTKCLQQIEISYLLHMLRNLFRTTI